MSSETDTNLHRQFQAKKEVYSRSISIDWTISFFKLQKRCTVLPSCKFVIFVRSRFEYGHRHTSFRAGSRPSYGMPDGNAGRKTRNMKVFVQMSSFNTENSVRILCVL